MHDALIQSINSLQGTLIGILIAFLIFHQKG